MLQKKNLNAFIIFSILLFSLSCESEKSKEKSDLIAIRINIDKITYNPILESNSTGNIQVEGLYADGTYKALGTEDVILSTKTKVASGNVEVISLEGNQIFPKEGGVASVEAFVLKDGKTFHASKDVTVRPFYREYHKTLVMKLFMGVDEEPEVRCTFNQAIELIEKTDNLTRGIPKIIYLVGWQKGGHDHLYPAWNEVNEKLKRPKDSTALQSLRWLITEAKKFNTTVSLHINMVNCFKESPLWDEYAEKDVIAKDTNGNILAPDKNGSGPKFYHLSYTREWEEGLTQRRIDDLIKMIPELKEGHTIHIDVFISQSDKNKAKWNSVALSPWHEREENGGITVQKEVETQRKIFKYWREKGFDVTGEGILWAHPRGEGFYGLQPMSWWYPNMSKNKSVEHQLKVPENLMARGKITADGGDYRFASSMQGEVIFNNDRENLTGFLDMFCRNTLPWSYLSQSDRISFNNEILYYSDGIVAGNADNDTIIRKGDYILRDGNDLFVEAKWKEREIIAYSKKGYNDKKWQLPESWKNVNKVNIYNITINGIELITKEESVASNSLTLSLKKEQAISIIPID